MVEGLIVTEEKPSYDEGRETLSEAPPRSSSEIMSNNPPFGSKPEEIKEGGGGYLTSAFGYFK